MLSLISVLLVLAFAAEPAVSPNPLASAEPIHLQKIGGTSTTLCTRIAEHANLAIGNAQENDGSLARLSLTLRATNFDNLNTMQRNHAIDALDKQAGEVRYAAAAGQRAVKDLRAEAEASTDPERKADLKAFADALGGALDRQRKEAVDFQEIVSVAQGREDVAEAEGLRHQAALMQGSSTREQAVQQERPISMTTPPASYTAFWKGIGGDLIRDHAEGIQTDERTAAVRSIGAVKGC